MVNAAAGDVMLEVSRPKGIRRRMFARLATRGDVAGDESDLTAALVTSAHDTTAHEGAAVAAALAASAEDVALPPGAQVLRILLSPGPNGLGLELDATNTIVNIVKGGAAEVQGYFKIGDTIASVDGVPLRGRLLQDVMDPRKVSYSFDVWRLARVEPDPTPPKPVRRALSFDRRLRR